MNHQQFLPGGYQCTPECFDELVAADGSARAPATAIAKFIERYGAAELKRRQTQLDQTISSMGVCFTLYNEGQNIDRAWPLDVMPRTILASEWRKTSAGLTQRLTALNLFINDLYHEQRILKAGVVPADLVLGSKNFLAPCQGITPRFGVWANICGTDLVRDEHGHFLVLEDNLRVPSGVSYMLENRETMMAMFPELFTRIAVRPVSDYPRRLARSLAACAPAGAHRKKGDRPVVAVLTPGIYNSAYYEHAFLADQMGAELVEGSDLRVIDGRIAMRTTRGYQPIDVIYRRVDDDYLDPLNFNPTSMLGVAGIMDVYRDARRRGDHGCLSCRGNHDCQCARNGHR